YERRDAVPLTSSRRISTMLVAAVCGVLVSGTARAQIGLAGEWGLRQHEDAQARDAGPEIGEYEGIPINDAGRMKSQSLEAAVYSIPHPPEYASHYLPGKNPYLNRPMAAYNIPSIASRGGAETMYPEFRAQLKDSTGQSSATK